MQYYITRQNNCWRANVDIKPLTEVETLHIIYQMVLQDVKVLLTDDLRYELSTNTIGLVLDVFSIHTRDLLLTSGTLPSDDGPIYFSYGYNDTIYQHNAVVQSHEIGA